MNSRNVLIYILASYMLGVFIFIENSMKKLNFDFWLLPILFFLSILYFLINKILDKKFLMFIIISIIAFRAGIYRTNYLANIKSKEFLILENKHVWITGKIIEIPRIVNSREKQELVFKVYEILYDDVTYHVDDKIIIYTPLTCENLSYGDFARCFVKLTKPKDSSFLGGFNHRDYLKQKSVYLLGFCDNIQKLNYKNETFILTKSALNTRKYVFDILKKISHANPRF